jgi:predicted dehydrogenase
MSINRGTKLGKLNMSKRKGVKSRFLGRSPHINYIPKGDRYLFDVGEPKYKFNVIGTGQNGCEHIRVTMIEGRATIHGIYDPNPGSIEKAKDSFKRFAPHQELVVYDSLEAACNEDAVDGLIISTPNFTHLDVLKVAVRSGKHIFLEKPMATTVSDAYEIVKFARDYPSVLQIGLQYRYKAMYVEAIDEALGRKSIGDVKMVSIVKHRPPFLDKVNQWNKFSKYSGGTLVEKCCHYFDMLNMFAQSRPVKVYATGSMAVAYTDFEYDGEKSDILDNALVCIEYANGVRASLNLCMFAPMYYEEVTVCGDEGHIRSYAVHDFLSTTRPSTNMEVHLGEAKPSRITVPAYPTYITESGHSGATFYEHIHLIDNIEGLQTDAATVEDGFWSVVVGAAAEESVKTGQPVLVDDFLKHNGVSNL